jgi:hypothetical protein
MIVGFGVAGAAFHFGWPVEVHAGIAKGLWIAGAVVGLLGLTGTAAALPVYWAWMSVAFVMGNIVSRIVLVLVYFGVVTPMGLIMRIVGRDRLGLRSRSESSYWHDLETDKDPSRYERQF